ncbi:MAG: indole-3-glycerol phosphate synthase TrpC [Deltaproteobacteria bacterium]|nr:indole-3-glycerol phosphate synthase TrpC [Deltaproteobacteria bacterium]
MILDKIAAHKKGEVQESKERHPQRALEKRIAGLNETRDFKAALAREDRISLIAEIKQASPSAGIIRDDFDPMKIAQIYEKEGADAISVLTDEEFFQGSLVTLSLINKMFSLPLLRKDFIIDPYQIYEARAFGADAILLIVSLLSPDTLLSYLRTARELGLSALVEVHTEEELHIAVDAGAEIIGINNRNLKTFAVDIENTLRLLPDFPKDTLCVSESGIRTADDIDILRQAGVDAILIGTAFMKARNIAEKVRELIGGSTKD